MENRVKVLTLMKHHVEKRSLSSHRKLVQHSTLSIILQGQYKFMKLQTIKKRKSMPKIDNNLKRGEMTFSSSGSEIYDYNNV